MLKTRLLMGMICLITTFVSNAQIEGTVTLNPSEWHIAPDGIFDKITSWDGKYVDDAGKPALPVIEESYVVPYDAVVSGVRVTAERKTIIPGSYYLYPAQLPRIVGQDDEWVFTPPDRAVYESTEPFPEIPAEIIADQHTFGYHVVTIRFYPFGYLPKERTLYWRTLDFCIDYTSQALLSHPVKPRSQSAQRAHRNESVVRDLVKNHADVSRFSSGVPVIRESSDLNRYYPEPDTTSRQRSLSVMEEVVPDYLIITRESLRSAFQTLADWKTRKGVPVMIKTVEEIGVAYPGSDLAEKIRNYLKEAYANWGAGLYVLLGGDTQVVPARTALNGKDTYSDRLYLPSDLYYATVAGTWNGNRNGVFNETADNADHNRVFYVGRAPVKSVVEANVFVEKVLRYERLDSVPELSYVNNHLVADAYIQKIDKINKLWDGAMPQLKDIYTKNVPGNIRGWLQFDNHACNNTGRYTYEHTGTCPDGGCPCGDEELNRENFLNALNNGGNSGRGYIHLVYHMDHSSPYNMGTSSIDKNQSVGIADMDGLTNGGYPQILITGGCSPARFSEDCIAEHYINNPRGGGVAFIGNADNGFSSEWDLYLHFINALFKKPAVYGSQALGVLHQRALLGAGDTHNCRFSLLGDPEMPVWSRTPDSLKVVVSPTYIREGTKRISVTVNNLSPGESALICLRKEGEGYATRTVSGNGTYTFSFTAKTRGKVEVTVTAHNYIPYESEISVMTGMNQELEFSLTDVVIDDDRNSPSTGNSDGRIDAGETIEMNVRLKNNTNTRAENVTGMLSCNSPYINLLNSRCAFGIIGSLSSGQIKGNKFVFSVDKDAPEIWKNSMKDSVRFSLLVMASEGGYYEHTFKQNIFAPRLEQRSKTSVTTSIELRKITFYADLFNAGSGKTGTLKAVLSSNSPYVIACNPLPVIYPDIAPLETKSGKTPFELTFAENYNGQPLLLHLQVENEYGRMCAFDFDLNEKTTQPAASLVNYTADDSNIELTWPYVSGGTSGYNVYRSDSAAGEYLKLNIFLINQGYFKDEGLNPLTSYYYKISQVTGSGNEGLLSKVISASTSFPLKPGFPVNLESSYLVLSSVNTEDVDGDGNRELFSSYTFGYTGADSYLSGLRYDGSDMFDIDGNVTTRAAFARFPASMAATPAVGQLYGDGEYQVVSVTRNLNNGKPNYVSCHSVKDRDGDFKPDLLWQVSSSSPYFRGPVIANLDNSADGSKEVVARGDFGDVRIFDNNGIQLRQFGSGWSSSAPAVADLDNDGDLEIVAGYVDGVYIWHHDGTPYTANPYFSRSGYRFSSTPVICDLDADGHKEIVIAAQQSQSDTSLPTKSIVYAIGSNGELSAGWSGTQHTQHRDGDLSHDISVGDLDGDGLLEVVAAGVDSLRVWNYRGVQIGSAKPEKMDPYTLTPILADVDGDQEAEIIVGSKKNNRIQAFKTDGRLVKGFPLHVADNMNGSLCVADVDGDGKNEIVLGTNNLMYMWATNGRPDRIEWGSERFNSCNTGEYVRTPQVDCRAVASTDDLNIVPVVPVTITSRSIRIRLQEVNLPATVMIYNLRGECVGTKIITGLTEEIPLNGFSEKLYIYRICRQGGMLYSGKLFLK